MPRVPFNTLILPSLVRFQRIEELSLDIALRGLLEPLIVEYRDQGALILAGTRRYLALRTLIECDKLVYCPETNRMEGAKTAYAFINVDTIDSDIAIPGDDCQTSVG